MLLPPQTTQQRLLFPGYGPQAQAFADSAYVAKVLSYSPIAYWPLWETNGTTAACINNAAMNGTYTNGPTLNQTGIGDGNGATSFSPTAPADLVNIYSAALAAVFDCDEWTQLCWMQVANAGVWSDGQSRRLLYLQADAAAQNRTILSLSGTGALLAYYFGSGTQKLIVEGSLSSTGWLCVAMTVSRAADQMKYYRDGTQRGATLTGIPAFSGGTLQSGGAAIGAQGSGGALPFSGNLAHVALWTSALSPAAIADLAVV